MISAERLRQNDPMWDLLLAYGDARGELALSDLAGGRDEAVAKANVAWEALWAHLRAQGLSQEDRDACNAGSMAAIQLSKIQPSKLQSEGWVEVAAILRRLGGQAT